MAWIYLGAQFFLLAAEINVVKRYRLWPRSITQPPLTEADRAVFAVWRRWRCVVAKSKSRSTSRRMRTSIHLVPHESRVSSHRSVRELGITRQAASKVVPT